MTLTQAVQQRILVLDGAMGTMIQAYKFEEEDYRGERFANYPHSLKGNNDLLVLTQSEAIDAIHLAYLEAGADIVETNTFNANSISLEDYHMSDLVVELNVAAVESARRAIQQYRENGAGGQRHGEGEKSEPGEQRAKQRQAEQDEQDGQEEAADGCRQQPPQPAAARRFGRSGIAHRGQLSARQHMKRSSSRYSPPRFS